MVLVADIVRSASARAAFLGEGSASKSWRAFWTALLPVASSASFKALVAIVVYSAASCYGPPRQERQSRWGLRRRVYLKSLGHASDRRVYLELGSLHRRAIVNDSAPALMLR